MDDNAIEPKKINWGAWIGYAITALTVIGTVIGIMQYYQQKPHHNINGTWTVALRVEKTSYNAFRNLELTYTIQIVQSGTSFSGSGEKTTEAGHELAGKAHTPISLTGTMDGDIIDAEYTENGVDRESHGEFHWKFASGKWSGTFLSTAADSSGTTFLTQISQ